MRGSRIRPWVAALLGLALCGPAAAAAPAFEDTMAQRMLACTGCHGEQGRAVGNVYFPRIAGKPAGYLFNQLRNFRDGQRPYALMSGLLSFMSDDYLQQIARYFAALDLPYPTPAGLTLTPAQQERAAELVRQGDPARGIAACATCHGPALTGLAPHVPGLLGLPRDYLNAQLGAWKTGQRRSHAPDCMAAITKGLTADEVALISHWLSAQPLPDDTHAVTRLPAMPGGAARPLCGSAPELVGGGP